MTPEAKEPSSLQCSVCLRDRPAELMRHLKLCLFCEIDAVRAELNRLEGELNFHPPKGTPLQSPCKRCKVSNWWVNLDEADRCPTCAAEVEEIAEALLLQPLNTSDFDIDAELDQMMKEEKWD